LAAKVEEEAGTLLDVDGCEEDVVPADDEAWVDELCELVAPPPQAASPKTPAAKTVTKAIFFLYIEVPPY